MAFSFLDRVVELERKVAEQERRNRNRKRTGTIAEVDNGKGLARVKIMDGERGPYLSPWVPWKEVASGGIKSHIPPTVGEQVDLVSENGDMTDAVIDMSTPSTSNPRPHDGPDAVITKGSVRVFISDDHAKIDAPNITFTAAGGNLA